jgi:hypothetical protein
MRVGLGSNQDLRGQSHGVDLWVCLSAASSHIAIKPCSSDVVRLDVLEDAVCRQPMKCPVQVVDMFTLKLCLTNINASPQMPAETLRFTPALRKMSCRT